MDHVVLFDFEVCMSIRGAVSSGQLGYDIALIEFQVLGKKEKRKKEGL